MGVYVDGKKVGSLSKHRMISFAVAPGEHVISAKIASLLRPFSPTATARIVFKEGTAVYLRYSYGYQNNGVIMYGNTPASEVTENVELNVVDVKEVQQLQLAGHIRR